MMKTNSLTVLFAAFATVFTSPLIAQQETVPVKKHEASKRLSPHETIYQRIGADRRNSSLITITYGRPYSRKGGEGEARKIWGELVKWDKPDRLGADEATLILLQHPIVAGGTTIPAGAYTLYIIPSEAGVSKLAFSSNVGKWGVGPGSALQTESMDVVRVPLKKDMLAEEVDQLTLAIDNVPPNRGVLRIMWEKTQFSLPFEVKR